MHFQLLNKLYVFNGILISYSLFVKAQLLMAKNSSQ